MRKIPWRSLAIFLIVVWSVFPLYWAISTSLTTNTAAQSIPPHWWPSPLNFQSYADLFGFAQSVAAGPGLWTQFSQALWNTLIECAGATVLTLAISLPAAYAFARMKFRMQTTAFYVVLATLTLPAYATLIPLYRMMSQAGLVNTYTGIILVYASGFVPLVVWMLYSFLSGIPHSIDEAAAIDGASQGTILVRIMLPLTLPGLTAAAIITFLFAWGQFLFPLVLSSDAATQPLTLFVSTLETARIVPYNLLNAAGVLVVIVPALITVLLNRYIIRGIIAGAIR